MNASRIAVATITLCRDDSDERRLREALSALAQHGLRVAVSDGGSAPAFVDFLREAPAFALAPPDGQDLLAQVKAALRAARATDADVILYTEPDKQAFFERHLSRFIERAPDHDRVGVVIASRSHASFARFGEIQQYTETVINQLCADSIGHVGDFCYGPFLMRADLVAHVERITKPIGWGWRPFLFSVAEQLGYDITHVIDDFPAPLAPASVDARTELTNRMQQLSESIEGLLLGLG